MFLNRHPMISTVIRYAANDFRARVSYNDGTPGFTRNLLGPSRENHVLAERDAKIIAATILR